MSFLDHNQVIVKEKLEVYRDEYEFYDTNGTLTGSAIENYNFTNSLLHKKTIDFFDEKNTLLFTAKKKFSILKKHVEIYDNNNTYIGKFDQKMIALTPHYIISDQNNEEIGVLKGNFTAWTFKVIDKNKKEILNVDKKMENAGDILKELLTTADSYTVKILTETAIDKRLLFTCPIIIDIFHHEEKTSRRSRRL